MRLAPGVCLDSIAATWTLRTFDAAATCVSAGYPTPEIYYQEGSSQNYIPKIRTPTLFLVSEDDPFLGCALWQTPGVHIIEQSLMDAFQCVSLFSAGKGHIDSCDTVWTTVHILRVVYVHMSLPI